MNPFFYYFKKYRHGLLSKNYFPIPEIKIKSYFGSQEVSLQQPEKLSISLTDALRLRQSTKELNSKQVKLNDVSTLLYYALSIQSANSSDGKVRRPYPSGGALYPLEVYMYAHSVQDLKPGLYHYKPDSHVLELVEENVDTKIFKEMDNLDLKPCAVVLFISFIKERSVGKYGYFAYKLGLLEAGHLAQNVYLLAAALKLGCRAFGNIEEVKIHDLLDIDGYNETIFYTIALHQYE